MKALPAPMTPNKSSDKPNFFVRNRMSNISIEKMLEP
jgi:hypothetical protein